MKKVFIQENWPDSWKYSYPYDLLEIYNGKDNLGYRYAYKNRQQKTINLIQNIAKPGSKILDVAAAQGNFSLKLAELGYEVTWNDLRNELIGYVQQKYEHGIISYAPGNILNIKFDSLFDIILIAEVIEHVAHPDEFLSHVKSLLAPGGHIILSTPNGEYFRNTLPKFSECLDPSIFESVQFKPNSDGHIFLLHCDEIKLISQQANLKVEKIELLTNSLTNGHIKLNKLLRILPSWLVFSLEKITSLSIPMFIQKKINITIIALLADKSEQ